MREAVMTVQEFNEWIMTTPGGSPAHNTAPPSSAHIISTLWIQEWAFPNHEFILCLVSYQNERFSLRIDRLGKLPRTFRTERLGEAKDRIEITKVDRNHVMSLPTDNRLRMRFEISLDISLGVLASTPRPTLIDLPIILDIVQPHSPSYDLLLGIVNSLRKQL
jgi:hypothetical protein